MTLLALAFCVVAIAINHHRMGWKSHALALQDTVIDYEIQLTDMKADEMEAKRAIGEGKEWMNSAADCIKQLKTERADLQSQLVASELEREMLKEAAGEWQDKANKEIETLKASLAKVADDRFAEVANRTKCQSELTELRGQNVNLNGDIERLQASNAFLVRECEKMDTQLKAIKAALVTQPEPAE
jgi:chromosome segregation ATPase